MEKEKQLGQVEHNKLFGDADGLTMQKDCFKTTIPLSLLDHRGAEVLDKWCVEEFERAYIDRENYQIVLECSTTHYLPENYNVNKG